MARTIWAPGILFILGSKTKVTGLENIEKGKHYILFSNHLSYLDIPALFKVIPLNLHFIAKKELRKSPFIGWYMRATGMIFIDRSNSIEASKSLTEAVQLIKEGKTVLIFPEGTVSANGEVQRFKKGGFNIAMESGIEILPVSIKGTNSIWPTTSNTKFKKGTVRINIGKPISMDGRDYNELNEIAVTVQNKVIALRQLNG
ncbi:lysophospholipid acyltransferase family protein [Crocinitomix catalasitica]|uniref:lysophospholipid acyltransferase family protein n=1 Tax=Crocinitomix catalasitica TaxID=184607 RepID=UPI000907B364|nr:lysophospholipid acyltransferase family protein [Crocinitomix catalasitica]